LNWWALFILIPAVGAFTGAYNRYRSTNDLFEMGVMMPALTGLVMLFLSFSMLFSNTLNINWGLYWPVIFIFPALGVLTGAYNRYRSTNDLFDRGVMIPALIGLFLLFLSFSLLSGNTLNINWSLYWPVILIIIGLGLVFGRGRRA
jgi:hypothetical protein